MLAILERIDPHSDRIDALVLLVEALRPRRPSHRARTAERVRMLTGLLMGHPEHASRLRSYLTRLLESRRHASLYTDIGILSNDGFVTELKRRIAYRILPPALSDLYLADAIDQVLYQDSDHLWIDAVPLPDWLALYDVIANAAPAPGADLGDPARTAVLGMLEAIRTLSCRVCALGLEPRLIRSHEDIENFDSPFFMQNIETNAYLDGYARQLAGGDQSGGDPSGGAPSGGDPSGGAPSGGAPAHEDARHLLVMLDQCDAVVAKVRRNAISQGTTVALTYLLVALTQSIERLRKLLYLVDRSGALPSFDGVDLQELAQRATPESCPPATLRRAAAISLGQELIEAHNNKYTVRDLFRDNIDLLARNVTENASRTGEHYIADSRKQLRQMFVSSAGAGFIVGFMAWFKILLGRLNAAPLIEAFLFSMNYSLGFVLIHILHFTIATKQPAMTAARIAASLSVGDGRKGDPDSMAALVNRVFRTQCVAVLGNLATVLPVAYAIASVHHLVTGRHLVNPEKAMHMLHDIDPIHSLALLYAAIAGVCLFLAGLISGYYDNKALYTRMAHRIWQLRALRRLLGERRQARLGRYIEDNLGGLMGNFYFGILLGTMGTLGYLLGLPLDIRHVTFSAANFATALVGLDHNMSWELAATSVGGFLAIGAVNLVVSFGLALWVALRARKIRFREGGRLLRALGRQLRAAPLDFFIGPKHASSAPVPSTRSSS